MKLDAHGTDDLKLKGEIIILQFSGAWNTEIAPGPFSGNRFYDRIETLICAILDQPGTRLPGSGKKDLWNKAGKEGIQISSAIYDQLIKLQE